MRPFVKQITDPAFNPATASSSETGHQLLNASGPYCSFCELPLANTAQVSTKVSASEQVRDYNFGPHYQFIWYAGLPWFQGLWQNKILSCASCAAWRDERPNVEDGLRLLLRHDAQSFDSISVALRDTGNLSEAQLGVLYNAMTANLIWPDTSADFEGVELSVGELTSSLLTFEFSTQTQRALFTRKLVRLDPAALEQPWVDTEALRLWVVPNTNAIQERPNAAVVAEQVENTILAHNLNYLNPSDPMDERVERRTIAYTTARGLWDNLLTGYIRKLLTDDHVQDPELLIEHPWMQLNFRSYSEQIQRMGFWSAWAFSLNESIQKAPWSQLPTEVLKNLTYDVLIQRDPLPPDGLQPDAPEPVMVLPGTDVDRLPWF